MISSKTNWYTDLRKFSVFLMSSFTKIIIFQDVPRLFLVFVEAFWYNHIDKYGLPGLQKSSKIKNLMAKMMKSGFYYTNPKRKNPNKPLNLLFKHNFTIKLQKITIIIMVIFPMIFMLCLVLTTRPEKVFILVLVINPALPGKKKKQSPYWPFIAQSLAN